MACDPETVKHLLASLKSSRFSTKAMFGEYALYADGKVVALLCDDRLFVKVTPQTEALAACEKAPPYPGAKDHYVVEEDAWPSQELARMLLDLSKALPAPRKKAKR